MCEVMEGEKEGAAGTLRSRLHTHTHWFLFASYPDKDKKKKQKQSLLVELRQVIPVDFKLHCVLNIPTDTVSLCVCVHFALWLLVCVRLHFQ